MANGWTGNILRVNLTTGNITIEDSSKFKSFVGGMGFGYKIIDRKSTRLNSSHSV